MTFRVRLKKPRFTTIHMAKSMDGSTVTARCGAALKQKAKPKEWSGWESDITCSGCVLPEEEIVWED